MNLSYLKYAVEVEKTGSITKAAQNFYMNQPHLSKIIREMERDLGCRIFDRTSRGMLPTEKGAEFLRHAKTILIQEEQIDALCARNREKTLAVSLCAPRAAYIACAVSCFLQHADGSPAIDVRYMETCAMNTIRHVSGKRFQLGIVRFQSPFEASYRKLFSDENLEFQELWQFSPVLLMSRDHPLSSSKNITAEDLEKFTEILEGDEKLTELARPSFSDPSEADFTQKHCCTFATRPSRSISIYDRGSQMELLRQLSGSYLWTSPIPRGILAGCSLIQKTCHFSQIILKDFLIFRKGYHLSREENDLLSCLLQVINRL